MYFQYQGLQQKDKRIDAEVVSLQSILPLLSPALNSQVTPVKIKYWLSFTLFYF